MLTILNYKKILNVSNGIIQIDEFEDLYQILIRRWGEREKKFYLGRVMREKGYQLVDSKGKKTTIVPPKIINDLDGFIEFLRVVCR